MEDHLSVSIHALHAEGDRAGSVRLAAFHRFNPRPPRGGRLFTHPDFFVVKMFQSTPSTRRATAKEDRIVAMALVSIHALHAEGDQDLAGLCRQVLQFQSTPSTRRATIRVAIWRRSCRVSIHALHAEGDRPNAPQCFKVVHVSIHALHAEGDP